jgi:hypothetical protein
MSTSIPRGNVLKLFAVQNTADVTSRTASTSTEFDFTVPGVQVGDIVVSVNKPSLTAGVVVGSARVKSANTVAVTFGNCTAGGVDPASEAYTFVIGRPETPGALPTIFNA